MILATPDPELRLTLEVVALRLARTGAKRLMESDLVMTALCLALIIKILNQLDS